MTHPDYEAWRRFEKAIRDAPDARVAAAERKGMEMALEIAEDYSNATNCDGSCARSIRADMETDYG